MENAISISHLSYKYEKEAVLENINIEIPKGSFLALVGPNGSGKSTLLKCVLGIIPYKQGSIKLFGTKVNQFKNWDKIGYVSQKANSFNTGFPATVFEVVLSGLTSKVGIFKKFTNDHRKKVEEAIAAVGMSGLEKRNIGELSGGQQQRVFIARALVSEPELLILDEPTVGVDAENAASFYSMLKDLNENGITLLLVTHDVGTITDKVTHVACLNRNLHFHGNTNAYHDWQNEGLSSFYGHDVHVLTHKHD